MLLISKAVLLIPSTSKITARVAEPMKIKYLYENTLGYNNQLDNNGR